MCVCHTIAEIRNRIRGGGGGDYQGGVQSTRRPELISHTPDKEEDTQDRRPPLYAGSLYGSGK